MADNNIIKVQQEVRQSAQKMQEEFVSLKSFEQEIKQKEKNVVKDENDKNQSTMPIRSSFGYYMEANKASEEIIGDGHKETTKEVKADGRDKTKIANEFKEKGNAFVKVKKYESAIEMYSKAIEICPKDPVYYSNRAQCYLSLERYNECIEDASVAIKIDRTSSKSYYRRMTAYEKLNEDMKALKNCQDWMSALPEDQLAKTNYDRIHNKLIENARLKEREKIKWSRSLVPTEFIEKPLHSQSKRSLRKVDVRIRKSHSPIPDDVIDKIFNNNTGEHTPYRVTSDSKLFKPNFLETNKTKEDSSDKKDTKSMVDESNQILKANDNKEQRIPSLKDLESAKNDLIAIPSTGPQFYTTWKELNEVQRFLYLRLIAEKDVKFGQLLGAQLESSILGEIITVVHKYFILYNIPYIQLIYELSKNPELTILAMLLDQDEKDKLNELLNVLKGDNDMNTMIHQISQNFQL